MEDGYVREARGPVDYAMSSDPRGAIDVNANRHGSFPTNVAMHRFRPFRDGQCDWQSERSFTVEVGPECVLRASVTMRAYDSGKSATLDFTEAEASVRGNQPCALALDGDRRVRGLTDSGNMHILARSFELTFSLKVQEWSDQKAEGFLKYRFDGTWID